MKTKEEFNQCKELSDDALEAVVGGGYTSSPGVVLGHWYTTSIYPDHILKVMAPAKVTWSGDNARYTGVMFAKYWYNGTIAWNHGTCSSVGTETYYDATAPASIDNEYCAEKPF